MNGLKEVRLMLVAGALLSVGFMVVGGYYAPAALVSLAVLALIARYVVDARRPPTSRPPVAHDVAGNPRVR